MEETSLTIATDELVDLAAETLREARTCDDPTEAQYAIDLLQVVIGQANEALNDLKMVVWLAED